MPAECCVPGAYIPVYPPPLGLLLSTQTILNDEYDVERRVVAKEELLALSLSPDYRLECDICDRNYMLRRGCPCCRD